MEVFSREHCINCNSALPPQKILLSSELMVGKLKLTLFAALKLVFPQIQLPPKDSIHLIPYGCCLRCSSLIGAAAGNLWEFMGVASPNTFLRDVIPTNFYNETLEILQENPAPQPHYQQGVHWMTVTDPPGQQTNSILENFPVKSSVLPRGQSQSEFQQSVRSVIHEEMKELVKITSFGVEDKNLDEGQEVKIPSRKAVLDECKLVGPTVLAALYGIYGKNMDSLEFSCAMRSAVGLACYQKKRTCSVFQRVASSVLWDTKATKPAYQFFGNLGISVSYENTLRAIKIKKANGNEDFSPRPKLRVVKPKPKTSDPKSKKSDGSSTTTVGLASDSSDLSTIANRMLF